MRTAIIHDWLTGMRGGENVLESMCSLFPDADIYTLVCDREKISDTIKNHRIFTSFLQNVPGVFMNFRYFLPLFPAAIESFNLKDYGLVLSSSHCVAKGARPGPGVPHVCYCHAPIRYAWSHFSEYFSPERSLPRYLAASVFMPFLRSWDKRESRRVTRFIANSGAIAARIREFYSREAVVIHPPVDTEFYTTDESVKREGFFLIVTALTEYKRVDFAVSEFNWMKDKKLVVVGEGPLYASLKKQAGSNIVFLGRLERKELRSLYRKAAAFIFPAEEDFGIAAVEAQACGCPVLALNKGGSLETVISGVTGEFFDGTPVDFAKNLVKISGKIYNTAQIRANSERFSRQNFEKHYFDYVQQALRETLK